MKKIVSCIILAMLLLGSALSLASCDLFDARDVDLLSKLQSGSESSSLVDDVNS